MPNQEQPHFQNVELTREELAPKVWDLITQLKANVRSQAEAVAPVSPMAAGLLRRFFRDVDHSPTQSEQDRLWNMDSAKNETAFVSASGQTIIIRFNATPDTEEIDITSSTFDEKNNYRNVEELRLAVEKDETESEFSEGFVSIGKAKPSEVFPLDPNRNTTSALLEASVFIATHFPSQIS